MGTVPFDTSHFHLRPQTRLLENILKRYPSFHDGTDGPARYGVIYSGRPTDEIAPSIIEHLSKTRTVRGVEWSEQEFLKQCYYGHYRDPLYYEEYGDSVVIVHDDTDLGFAVASETAISACPTVGFAERQSLSAEEHLLAYIAKNSEACCTLRDGYYSFRTPASNVCGSLKSKSQLIISRKMIE
jgi:hypothetical protein